MILLIILYAFTNNLFENLQNLLKQLLQEAAFNLFVYFVKEDNMKEMLMYITVATINHFFCFLDKSLFII